MAKSTKKGKRWNRVNKKIRSEMDHLADFEEAVEGSFAAARIIARKVAKTIAADFPDMEAAVRENVERAMLRAAPSEAAGIARQAAIEVLGPDAAVPEITLGLEANSLIGGTVEARAEMYTDATYATYENNVLAREMDEGVTLGRRISERDGDVCVDCEEWATDEFRPLHDLEEIGSSICGPRCRCEYEFQVGDEQFATSELFGGVVGGQSQYGGSRNIN